MPLKIYCKNIVHIAFFLLGKSHVYFASVAQWLDYLDHRDIEFFIETRPPYYWVTKQKMGKMLDFLYERGICPFWPQNPKKLPLQIFNDDEHSIVHEAREVSNKRTVKDKFIEIHFKDLSIHFSIKVGNNLCFSQDYINKILELEMFSRRLNQKIVFLW